MTTTPIAALTLAAATALGATFAYAEEQTAGPGDRFVRNNDLSGAVSLIDQGFTRFTEAGSYQALTFNYQFGKGDFAAGDQVLGGTVTPFLAVFTRNKSDGNKFKPIVVGSPVTYSTDTDFISVDFGSADTFTLVDDATVFAGFYWDGPAGFSNPIANNTATFSVTYFENNVSPVVGVELDGNNITTTNFSNKQYQFSITYDVVPEPAGLAAIALGGALLGRRRRR